MDANSKYFIADAFDFYRKFIYNEELANLLSERGFHVAGSVPSVNWELFASILTGERAKGGYGADLVHHEVKSATVGNSFEYQYHLNGGQTKLKDDMEVDHIFISYSKDYKDIDVRVVNGQVLAPTFEKWLPGLIENYEGSNPRQRYRKGIAYGTVVANGDLILSTRQGELI